MPKKKAPAKKKAAAKRPTRTRIPDADFAFEARDKSRKMREKSQSRRRHK